jgi:hypothetical protein
MARQSERDGELRQPARDQAPEPAKRPYRSPRLTTYGNLREIALVKGGTKNDGGGGVPASKA